MRKTLVRLFIAAIFAIAAWLSRSESMLASRVADAKEGIATFNYDPALNATAAASLSDYLPGNRRLSDDVQVAKATVSYWLGRYEAVAADTSAGAADAEILVATANAAFRQAQRDPAVGPAAVQRLDGVLQAYASALKASPKNTDAAYNYEFVSRVRDQVARSGKLAKAPVAPGVMGGDLPAGPTIHGGPGAPPPDAKMEELQTIAPMEYGDREAQPTPTPGAKRERKG